MRVRDSQRARVYKAERAAGFDAMGQEFQTVEECQKFVNKVTGSAFWRTVYAGPTGLFLSEGKVLVQGRNVVVKDGRGSPHGRAGRYEIDLPRWSRNRWVILHELAHVARPTAREGAAAHGREFCSIYLKLVKRFIGEAQAIALRQQFVAHHVRFVPRTTLQQTLKKAATKRPGV